MESVSVSAEAFWFAKQFQAKNDIRFYLNAVQIERHPNQGALVIGCDGASIGIYHDPQAHWGIEKDSIIVILNSDADKYLKPGRMQDARSVQIKGNRATVFHMGSIELFVQPGDCIVDAKYPDWRRVIPDLSTLKVGTTEFFSPSLLDRALKIEKAKGKSPNVTVYRTEKDGKIENSAGMAVRFGSMKRAFSYFMPLRDSFADSDAQSAFSFLKV